LANFSPSKVVFVNDIFATMSQRAREA
jgi:hypothetical protein